MSRRVLAVLLAAGTDCVLTTDLDGFTIPPSANDPDGRSQAESGAIADVESGAAPNEAGATSEAGIDADLLFADDFNRGDGPVANGWIEGKPGRYAIVDGRIPVVGDGFGFQTDYLYRPATAELDLEVSIEFTPHALPPEYPQVHLRASPSKSQCYAVGIPEDTKAFFWGRCAPNGDFADLGSQSLSEEIVIGRTYRLSLAVSGTMPVHLVMTLERSDNGVFKTIGLAASDDSAPERVTAPGMFGISADTNPNWDYDNFRATKLTKPGR
jgi:hypothetical protein